ncbi:FAD-binding protein [Streptomyces sp. NPDC101455]|uniref:FAD-binding protein n=1 Tax=Streptomyces sp. NPDC101455 TaxID=3366142 RepID=UPI003829B473
MTAQGFLGDAFKGTLRIAPPFLRDAANDFGHLVSSTPLGVLQPRSAAQVQELLSYAGPRGIPVAARGGAFSVFGQAQAPGGVVIDMSAMNRILAVQDDRVIVEAGARWRDVLAATLPRGLTPPVLTGHPDASVGGVLCTGGIGGASHRHGLVSDAVLELQVVTGAGDHVTCSAEHDADLFHLSLAGLGQCGIITRATVRLVPAPERVRRYRLSYDDIAHCLDDQRRLAFEGRFLHLECEARPAVGHGWNYVLEAVAVHPPHHAPDNTTLIGDLSHDPDRLEVIDVGYDGFVYRGDREERILRVTGEWLRPHPWLSLLLADDTAQSVIADVLNDPGFRDLRTTGHVLLHPLLSRHLGSPSLRRPHGPLLHLFTLLRTAPADDPAATDRMVAANTSAYQRARARHAVAYPTNALPMSREDWRDHYGERWDALLVAKRHHDPHSILARGHGLCG